MPRKRTSTAPPKLRAKLDTVEEINLELKRTYRLFINKAITHAEMSRRRELLVALRAGLPDPVERPKADSYNPPAIHVFSVPSDHFLTAEQIAAVKQGKPIFDVSQCIPLQLNGPEPPALEAEPRPLLNGAVAFPRPSAAPPRQETEPLLDQEFEPRTERERRLLQELEALTPEELLARAKEAGLF
jgi:hypothetical protein